MTRLHFPRTGAHYYLPVSLNVGTGGLFVRALVDTGASKCSAPEDVNNTYFHLPVVGHDTDVRTATAPQGLDFIQIPKIVVMRETIVPRPVTFEETDIQEQNVETWLSGDQIIIGMNFLNNFDITMTRKGVLTLENG